jgi:hypothetical protein
MINFPTIICRAKIAPRRNSAIKCYVFSLVLGAPLAKENDIAVLLANCLSEPSCFLIIHNQRNPDKILLTIYLAPPVPDSDGERDSHDPHEPWKDEVGHREAVPGRVRKEPVGAAAVVDKDHDGDGEAAEGVQRLP